MLGLIIICLLLASFFILVITLLCKNYTKDIIELEERLLELEKREHENSKYFNNFVLELYDMINEKEGEDKMACKKGRGGKKK